MLDTDEIIHDYLEFIVLRTHNEKCLVSEGPLIVAIRSLPKYCGSFQKIKLHENSINVSFTNKSPPFNYKCSHGRLEIECNNLPCAIS
jgi:hypothetical protein